MENQSGNGVLEEFRIELLKCWQSLPNKAFFVSLLAAWLALFHFLGSSTLGYIRTPSLLVWLYDALTGGGHNLLEADEAFGLLVPLVVLLLFWLKRGELLALELRLWWPGLALVGVGLGVHTLGYLVQQPRISVVGLITGIYGLMGMAWGLAWLRASMFPFFLLAFCIPLGSLSELITFPLRLLVTQLVTLISHFILAIDVEQHGNVLLGPASRYQYEVAAACSGIRSLSATILLAVVLGFVSFRSPWKRLAMIASAFPLAVLGNLLRMLAIVIAAEIWGQETGNQVHEGGPFGIYSLLPYVPGFVGLLMLEHFLRKPTAHCPPQTAEMQEV